MKLTHIYPMMLLVVIFTSCNPQPPITPNSPTAQPTVPVATQTPADNPSTNPISPINTLDYSEMTPLPPEDNAFVRLAEEDLAKRLGTSLDPIHFLKISEIDWQDISQGCTSPAGQTPTKGRLSGYRIWLEANGKNYLYHIGMDQTILFCPDPQ